MQIDKDLADLLWKVFQFACTGAVGVYAYLAKRNDATNASIRALEGNTSKKLTAAEEKRQDDLRELEARHQGEMRALENKHDDKINDHEARLSKVEGALSYFPTHDDVAGLKADVAGLKEETKGQTRMMETMGKQLDRISDWLVDKAK